MRLSGFERLDHEDIPNATWYIPSAITPDDLSSNLRRIQEAETNLSTLANYADANAPETYLKRKSNYTRRTDDIDPGLSSSDDDSEEQLFPAGGPLVRKPDNLELRKKGKLKRRRRERGPEDENTERRRAKEKEKKKAAKSTLWVHDSDDETDEEKDREFFAKEEERRKNANFNIAKALATAQKQDARKRKSVDSDDESDTPALRKKKRFVDIEDVSEDNETGGDKEVIEISSDSSSSDEDSDQESEARSTPVTSQRPSHSPVTKAITQDAGTGQDDVVMAEVDDASDDEPVVKLPVRRNVRAGFVVDSDSE